MRNTRLRGTPPSSLVRKLSSRTPAWSSPTSTWRTPSRTSPSRSSDNFHLNRKILFLQWSRRYTAEAVLKKQGSHRRAARPGACYRPLRGEWRTCTESHAIHLFPRMVFSWSSKSGPSRWPTRLLHPREVSHSMTPGAPSVELQKVLGNHPFVGGSA